MQLTPQELLHHLQHNLKPLYLLYGDEPLAQTECLDALRQKARQEHYDERTSYQVSGKFNWQRVLEDSRSTSLFSSRKILEIHIPSGKPGIEGSKALQQLVSDLPPDTLLIFSLPKLDKDGRNSAWFKALESHAVVVALLVVELAQLPAWISLRLQAQQQSADHKTLVFLANQVEGNLLAAHQEIQKLGLLFGAGKLDDQAVQQAVLNVSRYDAFQLGDALLSGQLGRTNHILQGLMAEGVYPLAILGTLTWLLNGVIEVKQAQLKNQPLSAAFRKANIWGDRQQLCQKMTARLKLTQLQQAIQWLAEIDKMIKGVKPGHAWLEISRLCGKLCSIPRTTKT